MAIRIFMIILLIALVIILLILSHFSIKRYKLQRDIKELIWSVGYFIFIILFIYRVYEMISELIMRLPN